MRAPCPERKPCQVEGIEKGPEKKGKGFLTKKVENDPKSVPRCRKAGAERTRKQISHPDEPGSEKPHLIRAKRKKTDGGTKASPHPIKKLHLRKRRKENLKADTPGWRQ